VRHAIIKVTAAVLLAIACQEMVLAQSSSVQSSGNLTRVVAFAVQREVEAGSLKGRSDLCLGFGNGLAVDQKAVMSELKRAGLKLHQDEWCNHSLRGLNIAIIAPIRETSLQTYELVLELSDPSPIRTGEHFATLLKRGTYVVQYRQGAEPQLVSYQQTCCSKTS
jgi:hypothetical protein